MYTDNTLNNISKTEKKNLIDFIFMCHSVCFCMSVLS